MALVKAVGIKNLKNNLSRYLQEVRNGESVYVTDRDEIIAEISKPSSAVMGKVSRWEAFLNAEKRKGSLRRATHKVAGAREEIKNRPKLPRQLEQSLERIYEDSRSDRF